jgi:hypothetical protein
VRAPLAPSKLFLRRNSEALDGLELCSSSRPLQNLFTIASNKKCEEKSGVTSKAQNNANSACCVNSVARENVEMQRKIKKGSKSWADSRADESHLRHHICLRILCLERVLGGSRTRNSLTLGFGHYRVRCPGAVASRLAVKLYFRAAKNSF